MNKEETNPKRNEPTEKGRNNDPNIRDDSGIQPGIQTNSKSDYDETNEHRTNSSSGNFGEDTGAQKADAAFDDIDAGDDA
ncbi:MAG TPA: hypothetical protein VM888_00045 [Chitinophagaceae bacterium]|nr:hypothetical protein [Chitinophagaceae bacterium]